MKGGNRITKSQLLKQQKELHEKLFEKPLIHREIIGEKVFVPLDTERLWGNF